jgi:hypothetical protein
MKLRGKTLHKNEIKSVRLTADHVFARKESRIIFAYRYATDDHGSRRRHEY